MLRTRWKKVDMRNIWKTHGKGNILWSNSVCYSPFGSSNTSITQHGSSSIRGTKHWAGLKATYLPANFSTSYLQQSVHYNHTENNCKMSKYRPRNRGSPSLGKSCRGTQKHYLTWMKFSKSEILRNFNGGQWKGELKFTQFQVNWLLTWFWAWSL